MHKAFTIADSGVLLTECGDADERRFRLSLHSKAQSLLFRTHSLLRFDIALCYLQFLFFQNSHL